MPRQAAPQKPGETEEEDAKPRAQRLAFNDGEKDIKPAAKDEKSEFARCDEESEVYDSCTKSAPSALLQPPKSILCNAKDNDSIKSDDSSGQISELTSQSKLALLSTHAHAYSLDNQHLLKERLKGQARTDRGGLSTEATSASSSRAAAAAGTAFSYSEPELTFGCGTSTNTETSDEYSSSPEETKEKRGMSPPDDTKPRKKPRTSDQKFHAPSAAANVANLLLSDSKVRAKLGEGEAASIISSLATTETQHAKTGTIKAMHDYVLNSPDRKTSERALISGLGRKEEVEENVPPADNNLASSKSASTKTKQTQRDEARARAREKMIGH